MVRYMYTLFISLTFIFISACGGEGSANKDVNYEATKKMVVDILQTEDGKKAIQKLITDEEVKKNLVIESDIVQDSIRHVFTSNQAIEMWSKLFSDPTFVQDFAKTMAEEQKKLMKALMNDSEFQKQMIELLQNPEISDQMLTIMKSQQFRSHLEETIQQTLGTPLFQSKMTEILLKAAEKQQQNEQQQSQDGNEKEQESDPGGESGGEQDNKSEESTG